ncbi:MAG: response regulator transcription factor [Solirubrobacterales bacterium]|nr:response regulator transcription factor [Solirubrobacterales bacterium]
METSQQGDPVLRAGPLEVRLGDRTVLADQRPLPLTVREFQILAALVNRAERVVSREELYAAVWHGEMRDHDRSVDVYVSRLRSKLERALPHWAYIRTHIGFGYCFSPRPSTGEW